MNLNPRTLIVDDIPAVRLLLRNMLEEHGYTQVSEAEDGEVAWELIQRSLRSGENPYQLVIADWNMPGMAGVDLVRAIRSFAPSRHLAVLMVTAKGGYENITAASQAGVTDYLVKPFNGLQLHQKIQEIFTLR